jgi:hypothetical protein
MNGRKPKNETTNIVVWNKMNNQNIYLNCTIVKKEN